MLSLKVRKVGNSLSVTLPREAAARLKVQEGDSLFLTESPDGGWRITPYDPVFEKKMAKAEEIMARYRNTLRALSR
jgi:putative addiction module antidote